MAEHRGTAGGEPGEARRRDAARTCRQPVPGARLAGLNGPRHLLMSCCRPRPVPDVPGGHRSRRTGPDRIGRSWPSRRATGLARAVGPGATRPTSTVDHASGTGQRQGTDARPDPALWSPGHRCLALRWHSIPRPNRRRRHGRPSEEGSTMR